MSTQQLSEQEKRVKIAEFLWEHLVGFTMMNSGDCGHKKCVPRGRLPDYFHSLDAMHEAEKVLTREQKWKYLEILGSENEFSWSLRHATAAQCAEAFGKTLGLWT